MSEHDERPPTPEELAAAEALRALLDKGDDGEGEDAALLRSLKLAHDPVPIDPAAHDAIVARALTKDPPKRGVVVRVAFGVSAALAVAAGFVVVLHTSQAPQGQAPQGEGAELRRLRSTQELFDKPFEGSTSARVDKIALARAGDLRENRFARWGVR